jgi:hypothetical protein
MKVKLKMDVVGYDTNDYSNKRVHAHRGDTLKVLLDNDGHYICDSKEYPGEQIALFPGIVEILPETKTFDELQFEDELENGTILE